MAPMMLKNFRLIAAQSSPVSPLGQLDYREGWFAIIPLEGQPGETLCGIQVHLNDKSLAEFPNRDWPAIEHWAEKGLLKPDVWKARRTNLSLIVKLEIPISGTAIQIQQQALQLDQAFFSCDCLSAIMARSVNCLDPTYLSYAVQVRLIEAKPIVQVRR